MIPEAKKSAVVLALQSTFGVSEYEDIRELTAGLSTALVYRIVVLGKPCLLRIITRTDPMADPTHQFACMKIAEEAGLAPRIWYTSIVDRLSITGFVEAKPFTTDQAMTLMPDLLRRLHKLPSFAYRLNYVEVADGCIRRFRVSKILPESMTDELYRHYEEIVKVYPKNGPDYVSCHNDLKPENFLYDGERVWIVDWEASFLNDRYTDLGMVANFVVSNEAGEKEFLKNYLGEEPTEYQLARLFLMRQILGMFYFTFLLSITAGGPPIDLNASIPGFREFHDGMWTGNITLEGNETRRQYAFVHMKQVQHNFQLKRFKDSLRIVRG